MCQRWYVFQYIGRRINYLLYHLITHCWRRFGGDIWIPVNHRYRSIFSISISVWVTSLVSGQYLYIAPVHLKLYWANGSHGFLKNCWSRHYKTKPYNPVWIFYNIWCKPRELEWYKVRWNDIRFGGASWKSQSANRNKDPPPPGLWWISLGLALSVVHVLSVMALRH